jgi:hypothetical protein
MRHYLSIFNLKKALALGFVITLMAIPRILQGGMDPWLYVPAAFLAIVLVSGAGTAWSNHAGMCGLFPERRRVITGIIFVFVFTVILVPVQLLWLDPVLLGEISSVSDGEVIKLCFPPTTGSRLALMLWVAGFETVFFQVGGMSFFARLTGNQWISITAIAVFRMYVTSRHFLYYGVTDVSFFLLASSAFSAVLTCMLFARAGLLATMTFSAMRNLHLFFYPTG